MAVVSEVKCRRCDKRYSSMRSRCPYCGARRSAHGKHANGPENNKIKTIIGLLLLLVLVVAVIVMLTRANNGTDVKTSPVLPSGGGVSSIISDAPSETPTETPSETPNVAQVESVEITYLGAGISDFTLDISDNVKLGCQVVPGDTGLEPEWVSLNGAVVNVLPNGSVTGLSEGTTTITCTVGGVTAECIVRVEK